MTTKKTQHKNYTQFNGYYQLVLSLNYEPLIPEDDSVRLLSQILEGLNYNSLYQAFSLTGRKPAVDPKILFKIITYAFSNGTYSTRKIEKACKRDINYMWLLEGSNAPDHSTIARFIKFYLCEAMEDLYYQLIQHLHSIGEITFKNIFIDGTKIEANANKYTFVWKKVVSKNEEKMFKKIQSSIENLNNEFFTNFTVNKESIIEDLQIILDFLKEKKIEKNIEFAHGIGKRKSKIQRFTEEFEEYNARQLKYNESNSLFDGRNSYSKTDKDATFMRMKDDHMRNSQLKPGYNVQIGVDSEYITAVDVYSDRSDVTTLKPFLENIQSNLGEKYENIIADAGYESEENYVYLSENEQNAYIKPLTYEQSKKRKFKKDISKRENMTYDKNTDE